MDTSSTGGVSPEEVYLASLHLLFIAFSYAFAVATEWYWGATMIVTHAAHERIVGDCLLSRIQKIRGHSHPDDDFFFHLFGRLKISQPRSATARIHLFIKASILLIVVAKAARRIMG